MSIEGPKKPERSLQETGASANESGVEKTPDQIVAERVRIIRELLGERMQTREAVLKEKQGWLGVLKSIPEKDVEEETVRRWSSSAAKMKELLDPIGREVPATYKDSLMLGGAIDVRRIEHEIRCQVDSSYAEKVRSGAEKNKRSGDDSSIPYTSPMPGMPGGPMQNW